MEGSFEYSEELKREKRKMAENGAAEHSKEKKRGSNIPLKNEIDELKPREE